jgi:lipopolysaccharide transport system permease protein
MTASSESEALTPSAPADAPGDETLLVIEPGRGWFHIDWRELWRYRELLYFLTWRDVKLRYKQTVFGVAWAVLQPLATMAVFAIFFGRLAGLGSKTGGAPYPVYVFAGLLPWTFFANAITQSGNSLVNSANIITKVYFPRLCIPFAAVGAGLVDLAVSLAVLLLLMLYYHIALTWQLLLVVPLIAATMLAAAGVGTVLAALTASYRDFRYIVPFMVQLWMFVTPVIYPSSLVPAKWRFAFALNPMSGLIEGLRGAFLGSSLEWRPIGISLGAAFALFFLGVAYFRRVERRFADVV